MSTEISEQQREKLRGLVRQLRAKAEPVGPLHGAWDTIFDIEQFLQCKQTLVNKSADEWIAIAEKDLGFR